MKNPRINEPRWCNVYYYQGTHVVSFKTKAEAEIHDAEPTHADLVAVPCMLTEIDPSDNGKEIEEVVTQQSPDEVYCQVGGSPWGALYEAAKEQLAKVQSVVDAARLTLPLARRGAATSPQPAHAAYVAALEAAIAAYDRKKIPDA